MEHYIAYVSALLVLSFTIYVIETVLHRLCILSEKKTSEFC